MQTATESDDELLASLQPGSFAVFYRRHVEDLVAFFMRRTRNAELAADLTAETFAAALSADPTHLLIGNVTETRVCSGSLSNQPCSSSSSLVWAVSIWLLLS